MSIFTNIIFCVLWKSKSPIWKATLNPNCLHYCANTHSSITSPLTCTLHLATCTSHFSSRVWPVAAASWTGVAPLRALVLASSPTSVTRKQRQSSWPQRAAWCTSPAPWASTMVPVRHPVSASSLRLCRSPSRAAAMAFWSTMSTSLHLRKLPLTGSGRCLEQFNLPPQGTHAHTHRGSRHLTVCQLAGLGERRRGAGLARWAVKVMKDVTMHQCSSWPSRCLCARLPTCT